MSSDDVPLDGPGLAALLASSIPYPRKVEALIAAVRARTTGLADVVRTRLPVETDPFVVATLASCLGRCGEASDGETLGALLDHEDPRVVANTLESLHRLRAPVDTEVVSLLIHAADNRVRTNALAVLGASDPERAMRLVSEAGRATDPARRAGAAYLMGELGDERAIPLLLDLLEREDHLPVVKQVAQSMQKHARPATARVIAGPLRALRDRSSGAKRSVLDALLYEVAVANGLVEDEVARLAEEHQQKRALASAIAKRPVALAEMKPLIEATDEGEEEPVDFGSVWSTVAALDVSSGADPRAGADASSGAAEGPRTRSSRSAQHKTAAMRTSGPTARPKKPVDRAGLAWLAAGAAMVLALVSIVGWRSDRAAAEPHAAAAATGDPVWAVGSSRTGKGARGAEKSRSAPGGNAAAPAGSDESAANAAAQRTAQRFASRAGAGAATGASGRAGARARMPGRAAAIGSAEALASTPPIEFGGEVVTVRGGNPLIRSEGIYYLVVRGPRENFPASGPVKLTGKILSCDLDGIYHVEAVR